MENVIIRIANISDLELVLLLSDGLTLSDLPFDKEVNIEWAHSETGKKYYENKVKGVDGIFFVAEVGSQIVGYATAAKKEVPTYRKVTVADLENIFVKEEFRSRGVGKMLVESFKNWAKESKFDKVSVNVFALNEKGIAFYKREGFLPQDLTLEMHVK